MKDSSGQDVLKVGGSVRIVLLGPPGAGKGSLASLCEERIGVLHISTGNIFRREISRRSVLGRRVERHVKSGGLVPDRLVVEVMAKRLAALPDSKGVVLDGFPRTAGQAKGLDSVLRRAGRSLDGAVLLVTPQRVLIRRLSGRRVCGRCGANYNVHTMRPKRRGRCDRCRGTLTVRDDDRPKTISRRITLDRLAAKPLLEHYLGRKALHRLDGTGSLEEVFGRLIRLCKRRGWLKIEGIKS